MSVELRNQDRPPGVDPARPIRILLAEDEPGLRFALGRFLAGAGFQVDSAGTLAEALALARVSNPDLALLDFDLPDGNALDLMTQLRRWQAELPVIVLTAFGTVELAVQSLQEGADQFLTKPLDLKSLRLLIDRTLAGARQRKVLRCQAWTRTVHDPFVGSSRPILDLRKQAERAALAASPVLLLGETGTGKGVLARWLHENGPRREEAFVDLNCAALTREFMEAELFGYEKGAFTGAVQSKPGLLELAHGGTVFLDEISSMDPRIQSALLKVVEDRRFRRLGSTQERVSDMRLLAAAHADFERVVQNGGFRSDLYFRLSAVVLQVPSLRERPEDIPVLLRSLFPQVAAEQGRVELKLTGAAIRHLQQQAWPGNIRELRNALERAVMMAAGPEIGPEEFTSGQAPALPRPPEDDLTLQAVERQHVVRVLEQTRGDITKAASILGIGRTTLYQRMKQWGLRG
ncbi:MAG: sigma-54-dependent Fis family transcriptional regulator [Acidobacteria bacterium]|nr:sigma-54-dependent Fis family transcriptional regulator [Acidobacteriota bacterium]